MGKYNVVFKIEFLDWKVCYVGQTEQRSTLELNNIVPI